MGRPQHGVATHHPHRPKDARHPRPGSAAAVADGPAPGNTAAVSAVVPASTELDSPGPEAGLRPVGPPLHVQGAVCYNMAMGMAMAAKPMNTTTAMKML